MITPLGTILADNTPRRISVRVLLLHAFLMGVKEIEAGCAAKYRELHAKAAAKFGDEKTSKAEKIILVILVIIIAYVLITFMLPLVPVVLLAARTSSGVVSALVVASTSRNR